MSAIPPKEFIKYLISQGHVLNIGILEHGEIVEEIHVDKDNIDKVFERLERSD